MLEFRSLTGTIIFLYRVDTLMHDASDGLEVEWRKRYYLCQAITNFSNLSEQYVSTVSPGII